LSPAYEQRVTVIHNGIDPDRVRRQRAREEAKALFGLPADAVVIGSLGRLDPAKGFEYLVRALPKLLRAEPHSLVVIAGSGPLQSQIQELARSLGVEGALRLLGFVADVRSALECMDVYVQPSLCEAHPLSLLEAGAIGLPLVVSAIGGMPESIAEGRTGYIVPPRDPEALVRALVPLVVDRSLRETMGREARAKSLTEFTRDRMVVRTMAVYDEMLGAESGRVGTAELGGDAPSLLEQAR
jgi:glycosyltransferase involved in cell wall biosynthesis